jgi:hypothetical protein
LSLEGAGTRNAQLNPSNPGVKEAAAKMAEEATAAEASTARKDAENLTADARGTISPARFSVTTTQQMRWRRR